MRLERISWVEAKEYFERKDLVVIPTGSIENHGTHMALGTDSLVPQKLVDMIEPKVDVLFAPIVNYGLCDHHMSFPGTISLSNEGYYALLHGIVESLYHHGARKIIFLNGHGGNCDVINRVGLELNQKGGLCALIDWWRLASRMNPRWSGGHAGGQETAAMLYVDDSLVNFENLTDDKMIDVTEEIKTTAISRATFKGQPIVIPRMMDNVSKAGWAGPDHPRTATKRWGEEMLKAVADYTVDFIMEFEKIS